jgi:hypothetical protein
VALGGGGLRSSLQGHEDILAELAELVLAVYAVSPAGSACERAKEVLLGLLTQKGRATTTTSVVFRAMMPLLTMKPGKAGLPTDASSRGKTHQKAVQVRALKPTW